MESAGCITMTHSVSGKVNNEREKMNHWEKGLTVGVGVQGHPNRVFWPLALSLSLSMPPNSTDNSEYYLSLQDLPVAC